MALFTHDTKVDALAAIPLFGGLSRHELDELSRLSEDLEVAEGKVLTRQGDIGREFFVIVEGEVAVERDSSERRRLGPGEFFGEIALLSDSYRRTATVTALTPLRFFVLTRQAFLGLVAKQPNIEDKVVEALEERLAAG